GIRDKLVTGVQTCALPICKLGREVQELGPRIEDRRGVFVTLEDELPAATPGRRGAKVLDGHAQPEARVAAGGAQDPGDQAGGGRSEERRCRERGEMAEVDV